MIGLNWRMVIVCEPVDKAEINMLKNRIYDLYNDLSKYAKGSIQHSETGSFAETEGSSHNEAKGFNYSNTKSESDTNGKQSEHRNSSHTGQTGESYGENTNITDGTNENKTKTKSESNAVTLEMVNKNVQEVLKYIDEELLERIKAGLCNGMFKTSVYYMGETPSDANRLKVAIKSLFQGNKSTYSPLRVSVLNLEPKGVGYDACAR